MRWSQDRTDVMLPIKSSKKPRCCILDKLEVWGGLLLNTRKEGVSMINAETDECMYDFFEVWLWGYQFNFGDCPSVVVLHIGMQQIFHYRLLIFVPLHWRWGIIFSYTHPCLRLGHSCERCWGFFFQTLHKCPPWQGWTAWSWRSEVKGQRSRSPKPDVSYTCDREREI